MTQFGTVFVDLCSFKAYIVNSLNMKNEMNLLVIKFLRILILYFLYFKSFYSSFSYVPICSYGLEFFLTF